MWGLLWTQSNQLNSWVIPKKIVDSLDCLVPCGMYVQFPLWYSYQSVDYKARQKHMGREKTKSSCI